MKVRVEVVFYSYKMESLNGFFTLFFVKRTFQFWIIPLSQVTVHSIIYIIVSTWVPGLRPALDLKGMSHEILGSVDRKNPFNIPVEGLQLILSTFLCLILICGN